MAKIPLLADPAQLQNGNQTLKTAQLPAVTNQSLVKGVDAIAQVSEGIMMKSRRAKDLTAMTSLDLAKSKAQIEFAKFQQENQDEEKWLPKWEETVGVIQSQAGEMSLTPEARQAVTSDLTSWSTRGTITVQAEAFKQAGRNARLAVDTAIQVGDQTGDYGPARKAVRGLRENNLISPEEEENTLVGIDQKETQQGQQLYKAQRAEAIRTDNWTAVKALDDEAERVGFLKPEERETLNGEVVRGQVTSDLLKVADSNPRQALQMAKDSDLPRQDKDYLEREIQNKLVNFERGEMASIADKVATGAIKNGDDVKFEYITSPAEQEEIKQKINALPPTANELVGSMLDLRGEIADFDSYGFQSGDKASMMKYVDINARIAKLPPSQRDDISKLWEKAKASQLSVKDTWVSTGEKIINEYYKAEELSLFDKDGFGGRKLKKGKEKEYAELKLKVTRMENDLKKLMPEDPKDAQAMDVINQVTTGSIIQQRKSSYMPPAKVQSGFAPIPAKGVEPAMPGGGGSIAFPILFPNITQ